jgi:excisionase family DNA binding protein
MKRDPGMCGNGVHEWIPENIHVRPSGVKRCLICDKERDGRRDWQTIGRQGYVRRKARRLKEKAMSGDALLTVREVAQMLRVSATFVYDNKAAIGFIGMGRVIRFRVSTVEAYIRRQSSGDQSPLN